MRFIKNFNDLAKTPERKIVLELAEEALRSIQPEEVFKSKIQRHRNILTIGEKEFDLDDYKNVYILGFGKGSAGNSKLLEDFRPNLYQSQEYKHSYNHQGQILFHQ